MTRYDFGRWLVVLTVFLALLPVSGDVRADSLGGVIASIQNRGRHFDTERFPDSVLKDFANDAQTLIATLGKTNQAESTYVLGAGYKYPLPSDFCLVWGAILNGDPTPADGAPPENRPYFLNYVPPEKYGSMAFPGTDRPSTFTVWGDSLLFDVPSYTETDTVTLNYFALPTAMVADSSAVDLPAAFVPLLKDAVEYMCINRIVFPGRADRQEAITLSNFITQAILGRKPDVP
jgi:hypothetical protein